MRQGDEGGIESINAVLAGSQYEEKIKLQRIFVSGDDRVNGLIMDPNENSEQVSLPRLPYEERAALYNSLNHDADQFQLLFVVRFIQTLLQSLGSGSQSAILTLKHLPSDDSVQFVASANISEKICSLEGHFPIRNFITRVMGLFTLPEEALLQYCSESFMDEDQETKQGEREGSVKNEMRALFVKVADEINENEIDFILECFFNKLTEYKNILSVIRNMQTILRNLVEEYPQKPMTETPASMDQLNKNFLILVGVYFAVLPAVKGEEYQWLLTLGLDLPIQQERLMLPSMTSPRSAPSTVRGRSMLRLSLDGGAAMRRGKSEFVLGCTQEGSRSGEKEDPRGRRDSRMMRFFHKINPFSKKGRASSVGPRRGEDDQERLSSTILRRRSFL